MKTTQELFNLYLNALREAESHKAHLIRILQKDSRLFNVSKYFEKIEPSIDGFYYMGKRMVDDKLEDHKEFFKYSEFPNTADDFIPF